jgi:hypothetical protein
MVSRQLQTLDSLTPAENVHGTHWLGSRVGPRVGGRCCGRDKCFSLLGNGNPALYPVVTQTKIFLIGIAGGGVQLGPPGSAATNRPTMPDPGDYDDGDFGGMMIGRGNRSTRRKPAPMPLCPPETPHACPDASPGRRVYTN